MHSFRYVTVGVKITSSSSSVIVANTDALTHVRHYFTTSSLTKCTVKICIRFFKLYVVVKYFSMFRGLHCSCVVAVYISEVFLLN
jgi:hypothetical protein